MGILVFYLVAFAQYSHAQRVGMERTLQNVTIQHSEKKVLAKEVGSTPVSTYHGGALRAASKNNVTVLVATPDTESFTEHALPSLQGFEGVEYTAISQLGELTVVQMLDYDVVMTFNISKWDYETGTTRVAWSNKLGEYISTGGYLIEALFVNSHDDWGLGSGTYITENMSPFTKSTKDLSGDGFVLGEVVLPDHPIMSGVHYVSTNYFAQSVTARSDAELIAKWATPQGDPLVAAYDNIVAFNFGPIYSGDDFYGPGLMADGYKMIHNAIVWLYSNQGAAGSPDFPSNLNAIADPNGELTATVSWTNADKTFSGEDLEELTSVTLVVNGEVEEVFENPTIGGDMSYSFEADEAGLFVFTVYGTNSEGDGPSLSTTIYIGADAPAAPENVELIAHPNGGKITWDAPTIGINGGYLNQANTVYTVIRLPNTVLVENYASTEFIDDSDLEMGNYQYKVIANNDVGEGGFALSNRALLHGMGVIFYEPFDGVPVNAIPVGWAKEGFESASWVVRNTSNAGGKSPEMELYWVPLFDDLSRLVTTPIPVGDNDKLRLKLNHFLSFYSGTGNTLAIQVSFDGGEWTNLWETEISGSFGPKQEEFAFDIPTTASTFRIGWEFDGNVLGINNYNIDDVTIEPVKDNDLAATGIVGNPTPSVGSPTTYIVTVQNPGNLPQTNYSVKLMKLNGGELVSVSGGSIQPGESKDFQLNWSPSADDEGAAAIYGEVVLANDEFEGNNKTSTLSVVVQPEGINAITIGQGTAFPNSRIPFDFFANNSLVQTIYYAHEIGLEAGAVTSIAYTNEFAATLADKSIKVWMGETDLENLSDGWIPLDNLELVYDGEMDFPSGVNSVIIPLQSPFIYNGGNLIVYSSREWEAEGASSALNRFYGTQDHNSERTRLITSYGDAAMDPANPGEGRIYDWYANTVLYFNTAGLAEITGTVLDAESGDPVEGVLVETVSKARTYTNNEGIFSFVVIPGEYDLTFQKFGYETQTIAGVSAEAEEVVTIADVNLIPVPQYTVSGVIKGNDDLFLDGATITFEGYDNYEVTSIAEGVFTILNVYEGTYSITVEKDGYESYLAEGIEVSEDLTLGTIVLTEAIIIPSGLVIDPFSHGTGKALFSWTAGETLFRYDDGSVQGQIGFENGTLNSVMGAVHHHNATLSSVSWFLTDEGGPHATVKVWILGLTSAGAPNASDILFEQNGVPNVDMQWNTLELPDAVHAPYGFYIAIGYAGFTALATDSGEDSEWPFKTKTHYAGNIATGQFFTFESQQITVNALIRATGSDHGELRFDTQAKDYSMVSDFVHTQNETTFDTNYPETTPSTRAFVGYKVFLNNEEVVQEHDETQYLFTDLDEGNHTAGVQAVHTTGSSQIVTIDFVMDYGVDVKVNITTNSGDSAEGASVSLVSNNHNYAGVANADGVVHFPIVFKDTYHLTVSFAGFESQEQQNITILEDKVFDVNLIEVIMAPSGLYVEQLNENVDAKFSWNSIGAFFDDMEAYEDFIIENIGDYTLIDGDGADTHGIGDCDFPNENYKGSYIVFNPNTTTPPVSGGYDSYSGDKYLGCIASFESANNDWLVLPKLHIEGGYKFELMAKSLAATYGLERMKIGVSTTGTEQSDFTFIHEGNYIEVPTAWTKYSFDLSNYEGQEVHLAINCVSNDAFMFMVDDIYVGRGTAKGSKSLLGYKVYLDGQLVSGDNPIATTEFVFEGLEKNQSYAAGVRSVYSSGESEIVTLIFSTTGTSVINNTLSSVTTYPNPFNNQVSITNAELVKRVIVTNALGQRVMDVELNGKNYIDTQLLTQGVYLILLQGEDGNTTVRRMVKN